MIDPIALLGQPRLSVVSSEPDDELEAISRHIAHSVTAGGPDALDQLFERLLEAAGHAPVAPKTLDLIGHARTAGSLLALGDWVITGDDPDTLAWLDDLAGRDVLPRLGVHALRLLGCQTAGTAAARATITTLAGRLGVEAWGTTGVLYRAHYDPDGFLERWGFLLVSASELRRSAHAAEPAMERELAPRCLDLAALPATPLGAPGRAGPRRIADAAAAARVRSLVLCDRGARTAGSTAPLCELALPTAGRDGYHVAHVLYDGAFVELYPDGADRPGIAFPVRDADALLRILAALPAAPAIMVERGPVIRG